MTHGRAQRWARLLALVVIALAILSLLVTALPQMRGDPVFEQVTQVTALWFFVPGAIVVLRRDGHVIGWLLVAAGLFWAIQLGGEVGATALAWMPPAWRVWITEWTSSATLPTNGIKHHKGPPERGSSLTSGRRALFDEVALRTA